MKRARWMAVLLAGLLLLPSAAPALAATQGGDRDLGLKGDVYQADTATVLIYDGSTGPNFRPLSGVTVKIGGYTVVTGRDGKAVFTTLKSGTEYTVELSKTGYLTPKAVDVPAFPMADGLIWTYTLQVDPNYNPSGGGGDGGSTPSPEPSPSTTPAPSPSVKPTPTPDVTPTPGPTPSTTPGAPSASPVPTPGGSTPPSQPTSTPGGTTTRPPRPSAGTESPPPSDGTESPPDDAETTPPYPPDVVERPGGPIQVIVPEGKNSVSFDRNDMQESAAAGRDHEFTFPGAGPDGEDLTVTLEAFTPHDSTMAENSTVTIEVTEDGKVVVVLESVIRAGLDTVVDIPHNVISLVRGDASAVRVLFEDEKGDVKLERVFEEAFFTIMKLDEAQDVQVEYVSKTGTGWIILTNQASEHEGSLFCPKEVYEKAAADDLGIRLCIYNPEDGEDLWYEWVFEPVDLAKVKAGIDTNLFITSAPNEDDAILDLIDAKKNLVQYMIVNYHGKLPAPAQLWVKDQTGFQAGSAVSLVYSNTETGELETIYTDLTVEDGFVTYGIDHCSSYALTAPRPVSWLWLILLIVALVLVVFFLILFWRRKKKDSDGGGRRAAQTILHSAGVGEAGGHRE